MRLFESFTKRKFILFNLFLTLYIGINLLGGERGLSSYFDKKNLLNELTTKEIILNKELIELRHKINLIKKSDPDFIDILYLDDE